MLIHVFSCQVYAKGGKTIAFTRTKRDADEVSLALTNSIASEALHGDISQHQRERTLRACSDRWIWSLLGSAVRDPSTWFGWRVPGPF